MAKRNVDLKKIFAPSDSIAFIVIALGLFIALFLDEMAVRLIGVCIAILGGVALFMMISPRLAELSMQGRPPRPSESPLLSSQTRKDYSSTSTVFERDAFMEAFGSTGDETETMIDENQIPLFDDPSPSKPARSQPPPLPPGSTTPSNADRLVGVTLDDSGESSVRVVRVRPSSAKPAPPPLVIEERIVRRSAEIRASADVPADGMAIETPDGDSIVIRRKPKDTSHSVLEPDSPASTKDNVSAEPPAQKPIEAADVADAVSAVEPTDAHADDVSDDVTIVTSESHQSQAVDSHDAHTAETSAFANVVEEPHHETTADNVAAEQSTVAAEDPSPSRTVDVPPAAQRQSRAVRASESGLLGNVSTTLFAADDNEEDMGGTDEPRKEFDFLLNRVLMVIRSATNARTAAFFWVNADKRQLVVESRITEASDSFTEQRKIPMGRDAVSQIALEGRPEILTEISASAELDLLPYYTRPAGTVSFIGVPVYYGGRVVGVLCADSLVQDAYSDITVGFFGQFTKLISGLVQSYTGKFELLQASQTLSALTTFRRNLGGAPSSTKQILRAIFEATINSMDVSTIGVVMHDAALSAWTVVDVRSVDAGYGDLIGRPVDLSVAAVGESIVQAGTIVIDASEQALRIAEDEPAMPQGQFVAVPLRSDTQTYGALFIENHAGTLSQQQIQVAETLGEHAGLIIEQFRHTERLEYGSLLDPATNVLNRRGFDLRCLEEFDRAVDQRQPFTVCYIRIDRSRAYTSATADQQTLVVNHVLRLIRHQLRTYDLVARIESGLLAIGLVGFSAQQAQMWTENIRNTVASSVMNVDGRRFSATVSIGVAEATPRDTMQSLLANVMTAVTRSEQQSNKVTVFA